MTARGIASQNGLNTDWIIIGSLSNEGRESTVTPDNYRQSRVETTSGLGMHLTRQDTTNPYGQLAVHLQDSDAHDAHISLGTNQDLLDTSASAHGIQESSTGYAKRVASGNHYETVGDVNNPITQSALTQDSPGGFTQHHTEINVGKGSYSQIYQSNAAGVKTVQAVAPLRKRELNPGIVHYFYVVPEKTNIVAISNELLGETPSKQKALFDHINLNTYGGIIPAGAWVYLPMQTQTYKVDDIAAVRQGMTQINTTIDQQSNPEDLSAYGLWHQLFGWFLDNTITLEGAYFKMNSQPVENALDQISDALNKIGQINAQAKASIFAGNAENAAQFREQAKAAGAYLHTQVQTFINKLALPEGDFKTTFEKDTQIAYDRNVLGIKSNRLGEKELAVLSNAKLKSLKISSASKLMGYTGTTLNGVTNAADAAETCRKYGDGSTLCHETGVGDSAYFGGSEFIGNIAGTATFEWLGCNALLDIETLGLGTVGCTIAVGGASAIAGSVTGSLAQDGVEAGYRHAVVYSQRHDINKQ